MKIHRNLITMAAVAAALTIAAQARAAPIDTTSFFLNQPECTGTCTIIPGLIPNTSAVEVTINLLTSTTATVVFQNPTSGNIGAPVLLNVSGAFQASSTEPLAPSSPCGGNGFATPVGCSPGSEDHFGTMSLETGAVGANTITINLIAEGSNSWASALAVLHPTTGFAAAYGHGFEAVVATGSNGVQDAGFATPLPAALPLFATGIGGLGLLGWRRKRKAQAV